LTRPILLQVDDDGYFAALYRQELEELYDVEFCRSAEEALRAIEAGTRFQAVLLDIMMAPPSLELRAETNDGLSTGIWLLKQIRDEVLSRPLPVIVLTNRTDERLAEELASLNLPESLLQCHQKRSTSAVDLVPVVQRAAP